MSRALKIGALLVLVLAARATAQTAVIVGGARVTIPSGDVLIGAHQDAIFQAAELCRRESRFDGGASCTVERFASELQTRIVHLPAFAIDRTEVSRGDYRACVAHGACAPSDDPGDEADGGNERLPVVGVDLRRAERYCRFAGGRLPTEAEWTRAARGSDERPFPWGFGFDVGLGNHGRPPLLEDGSDGHRRSAPVGSFPGGASPFGVLDLAGNVWEWTSSLPTEEDLSLLGTPSSAASFRVVRGGSFLHPAYAMRVTSRSFTAPLDLSASDLGLRCVYDLP